MRKDPKNIALPRIDATPEQIAGALLAFVQPPVKKDEKVGDDGPEDLQDKTDGQDEDQPTGV